MFDWNDEELANIIWGDAGESDDHTVPYPNENEKKPPATFGVNNKDWNQEVTDVKPTEQTASGAKIQFHGNKQEHSTNLDINEGLPGTGFSMGSWSDLSSSNAAKTNQDSMAETTQLDKDPEIFRNQHDENEQGDFVDYGWANIGSFDDLDRIFSNDAPVFGNASLGNADELWSSSTNSPVKSFPLSVDSPSLGLGALRNTSEHFEIKTEHVEHEDQSSTPAYGIMNHPSSHGQQNTCATMDQVEYGGGKSKPIMKDQIAFDIVGKTTTLNSQYAAENAATPNKFANKANRQKKLLKSQKKLEEKNEGKLLQNLYGTWCPPGNQFQQYEIQFAPTSVQTCPSSVLSQQRQLQGHESLHYQHISSPFTASSAYTDLSNKTPVMPALPHTHSGQDKHQQLLSSYEVPHDNANPLNKSLDAPVKPLTMTPQEKVEKLRRRQQIRAMLAIQKQQQQFNHQVSCTNPSITHRCSQENQNMHMESADGEIEENLSALSSLDPNSPMGQDDSITISMKIDAYSAEDTILSRLQDIVLKLDIRIRLCIRDSLFRLSQSAMQRHFSCDTSSTNQNSRDDHEFVAKEEINSHNRYVRMGDMETETNPIDRTVAHLLFHRPLELPGRHPEAPESPFSSRLPCEHKTAGLVNSPMGCSPEGSKNKQSFFYQGPKSPCRIADSQQGDQFKNSPCIDTSENASNNETAEDGTMEVEPSQ